MRIGLVDVDGHASKKKWGATIYPNLALCKISRYHKEQGDHVEWADAFFHYDIVYRSKVFNFSPDDRTIWHADKVICGGTGYMDRNLYKDRRMTFDFTREVNLPSFSTEIIYQNELPQTIDRCQPDYSIYPNIPKGYAYGFLTRGCPNKCRWCVVPKKEGTIRPYMDVDEIAIEGRNKLVLMDNNFLAAGDYAHEQLDKIISRKYKVDFNQALDARLVTDDFARQLAKVRWLDRNRIRFGCDTQAQIYHCERAMDKIMSYGFTGQFFLYTMLDGDFYECYSRIYHWWEKMKKIRAAHHGCQVYAYAQPYRSPTNPQLPIPQWQKDMAGWVNKKAHFVAHSFEEFEPRKGFKCIQYFKQFNK